MSAIFLGLCALSALPIMHLRCTEFQIWSLWEFYLVLRMRWMWRVFIHKLVAVLCMEQRWFMPPRFLAIDLLSFLMDRIAGCFRIHRLSSVYSVLCSLVRQCPVQASSSFLRAAYYRAVRAMVLLLINIWCFNWMMVVIGMLNDHTLVVLQEGKLRILRHDRTPLHLNPRSGLEDELLEVLHSTL